jgi:hypothetical protein
MARAAATVNTLRAADPTVWSLLTATAANVADKNYIDLKGGEYVIVENTDASPHNFVITSSADKLGRTLDISEAISAGAQKVIRIASTEGWAQSGDGGRLYFEADDATVEFTIIRPTA